MDQSAETLAIKAVSLSKAYSCILVLPITDFGKKTKMHLIFKVMFKITIHVTVNHFRVQYNQYD